MTKKWDPQMPPRHHVRTVGLTTRIHWYVQCAGKKNGVMFSIGYAQTINGDYVFLFYDDYFGFVIILCAKVPSLMANDEPVLFRHGMLSTCDENRIVIDEHISTSVETGLWTCFKNGVLK